MLALLLLATLPSLGVELDKCSSFQARVRTVYDFRPSKLNGAARERKAKEMDEVWKLVKADQAALVPCLRAALGAKNADAWFRVDGSALLVEVDPSRESREIQCKHWTLADWKDLDPQPWMSVMANLGALGHDTSAAGKRWLDDDSGAFDVAQHAMHVDRRPGSFFLFGSLDETIATPALARLARDRKQSGREVALELLASQATPEALKALRAIDLTTFPKKWSAAVEPLLGEPTLLAKRDATASFSREKLLETFRAFLQGNAEPLDATRADLERHWAEHVVGVLKPEDLSLLRQVRRKRMTYLSDEALEDYYEYSLILMTLVWKPEFVR